MNHLYYAKLQLLKLLQERLQLTFFFPFFLSRYHQLVQFTQQTFNLKIWTSVPAPVIQITAKYSPVFYNQQVDWFIS